MRYTRLYINLDNVKSNILNIQKYFHKDIQIMPIIKCSAYGTQLNEFIEIIENFEYVGVALVDEGVFLRNNGYKGNIFILYPPSKNELKEIIKYNLFFNGCDIDILEYFNKESTEKLTIHIEVDTGMGRTGIQADNIYDYISRLKKLENITVDGVYSHLSCSSSNIDFSKLQINRFNDALDIFKNESIDYQYSHICNSGAIFNFKDIPFNMVRIGLLVYGYYPNPKFKSSLKLLPSMRLKTNISFLKTINAGDTVGYNKNFIAKRKTAIATVPFGFGDGLIGLDAGEPHNPYMLVNKEKAPIVAICMDNMMLDVTYIPNLKVGDEVVIFDNELLSVEEVASWCSGICNYELISSLSNRIPRIFNRSSS